MNATWIPVKMPSRKDRKMNESIGNEYAKEIKAIQKMMKMATEIKNKKYLANMFSSMAVSSFTRRGA